MTKTRGLDGLPPLFRTTATEMCKTLNTMFKAVKRNRKLPKAWKIAAVSPIHKKGQRKLVENYRPVSLLNIESKIFEKSIYEELSAHFTKFLSSKQHRFVPQRSVCTNMLLFLKKIHEALDKNVQSEVVVFYTDFAKAFDRVPHYELLLKAGQIGIGGCLLEVLYDYLNGREQFVRVENIKSKPLPVTSGVPQGSLLGPILFCIYINDLPDALRFGEPLMFADDLKILYIGTPADQVQSNLDALEDWLTRNKMGLAIEKCAKLLFKGPERHFYLCGRLLQTSAGVKDLWIWIQSSLTWRINSEERMKKAKRVFYSLRRNVAFKVNMRIKLGLYKSMILPVLMYGSPCCNLNRGDMRNLERFQRKVVSWITNSKTLSYIEQLRLSNLLPLPMYYQLNDLLLLSSLQQNQPTNTKQQVLPGNRSMRRDDYFDLTKKQLEKSRGEFFFRTQRIANRLHHSIDFGNQHGLKHNSKANVE